MPSSLVSRALTIFIYINCYAHSPLNPLVPVTVTSLRSGRRSLMPPVNSGRLVRSLASTRVYSSRLRVLVEDRSRRLLPPSLLLPTTVSSMSYVFPMTCYMYLKRLIHPFFLLSLSATPPPSPNLPTLMRSTVAPHGVQVPSRDPLVRVSRARSRTRLLRRRARASTRSSPRHSLEFHRSKK
jgi:hypothetical protein